MRTFVRFPSRFGISHLRRPISESDPQIYEAIMGEKKRQVQGINLIASENYCSNACFAAVGSVLNNKYSEGYPGSRYYGGTEFVDKIENLCRERALKAFNVNSQDWGVNVQGLSGSPANMAVFTGLLEPHERIMSLDLPHGGHLSHGFMNQGKKISATSKYFEVLPYFSDEKTGEIDYEQMRKYALIYRPKLIIAGTSAYSRLIDYKKFRQVCDQIGAYLMADMAHPAGLISAGLIPSPFEYADVVTTTTHKTLRGPRGALIFYKLGARKDKKGNEIQFNLKQKIDSALFPGLQGGPHNHAIAGIAVALGEAITPEFKEYQKQVIKNIQRSCQKLKILDYNLVTGGTDNHLALIDMRNKGVNGSLMEALLNEVKISINKNTVPGDKSALVPSAIRIGSPAMTTRGLKENQFDTVVEFIDRSTKICQEIKKRSGPKLKDFKVELVKEGKESDQLIRLKKDIQDFAKQYPVPGGLL